MRAAARGVARRYAQALLDLAEERGRSSELREALDAAQRLLAPGSELLASLDNPALPAERQQALVSAVWPAAPGSAEELVARLLGLLVARRRVALLAAVGEAYGELWNTRHGVVAARATSAAPLAVDERQALQATLRGLTGREVELTADVDPQLMGGVVLEMEGRVYDGSVRSRLNALRERLALGGRRA